MENAAKPRRSCFPRRDLLAPAHGRYTMRPLPLLLVVGMVVVSLAVGTERASSGLFGQDIWTVRLDSTPNDHWVLLDTGRIKLDGKPTFVFLLAHQKERAPAGQYDAMKAVGGQNGGTLWAYNGTGYVDGSDDAATSGSAPRFRDVDGDGSDDVVFMEQDSVFGQQLRAVRIEP